jgi:hypothetical protein
MTELWIAIVLEVWYQKSKDELERYNYSNDREGFRDAMGFQNPESYTQFMEAWT